MWFLWAILGAFSKGIAYLFRKEAVIQSHHIHTIPIVSAIFALPLLGTIALIMGPGEQHEFTGMFFLLLLTAGVLNAAAVVSGYKAFRHGELSEIVPLTALMPVFLILTSWIILGEFPPLLGILGVILIALGSLISHTTQAGIHLLKPFADIFKSKANRYMLLTVLIWSVAANIDKIGLRYVPPATWSFLLIFVITLLMFLVYRPRFTKMKKVYRAVRAPIIGIGVLGSLTILFQTAAIKTTYVSYVLAIKRFDVIIAIILAHIYLKEHDFKKRFEGAILMVIGVILIGIA